VRLAGEFELRRHTLHADQDGGLAGWNLIEGSHALPLAMGETFDVIAADNWRRIRNHAGYLIAAWNLGGYTSGELGTTFDPQKQTRVNIIHPKVVVLGLGAKLDTAGHPAVFTSLYFASPKPPDDTTLRARAAALLSRWKII
jgi:hypothetical protein